MLGKHSGRVAENQKQKMFSNRFTDVIDYLESAQDRGREEIEEVGLGQGSFAKELNPIYKDKTLMIEEDSSCDNETIKITTSTLPRYSSK